MSESTGERERTTRTVELGPASASCESHTSALPGFDLHRRCAPSCSNLSARDGRMAAAAVQMLWDDMKPFAKRNLTKAFHANQLDLQTRPLRWFAFKPLGRELLPTPMTEREKDAKKEQAADAALAAKKKQGGGGSVMRAMIGGGGVEAQSSRESLAVSRPSSVDLRQSLDAKVSAPAAESVQMWTPYDVRSWLTDSLGVPTAVARAAEKAGVDGRAARTMQGPDWIRLGANCKPPCKPLKAAEIVGGMKILPAGSCMVGDWSVAAFRSWLTVLRVPTVAEMEAEAEAAEKHKREGGFVVARTETPCSADIDGAQAIEMSVEEWVELGATYDESTTIVKGVHALVAHGKSRQREKRSMLRALEGSDGAIEAAHLLAEAPLHLQADKEVVCAAVSKSGIALQFAATALQADEGVVRLAVGQNGYALQYTAPHLLMDTAVVRTAATASVNAAKLHCDAEPLKELVMKKIEKAVDKDCVSTACN